MEVGAPVPWGGKCDCHGRHHSGGEGRIPLGKVPRAALQATIELLGRGAATDYFKRRYRADTSQPGGHA
jgi:hypothetical protein